jgi:dehydrodolichyl diphosphate syntase complex subunit NUS1
VTAPHAEAISSAATGTHLGSAPKQLKVLLISFTDGREAMVDLTKTLAEMSQKAKLTPSDIHTDLIDAELSEGIMPEPDLLLLFGPFVKLDGYPPWQIRLTEIFCLKDNHGVGYQVFIRALRKYSAAQMRHGK